MSLKLACADFAFPLLEHDKVLHLISVLEFKGVDIGLFEERSHLWPSREFVDIGKSAGELKRKLNDFGLVPADVFLQMAPDFTPYAANHPDPKRRQKSRDRFLRTLEYANTCWCRHVTSLPGVHFEEESYEESFNRCVDEMNWRVEQASLQGLVFGVEAHVGSIAPTPVLAEKLVQSVPGLTLTLDYTHFTRSGLPDSEIEPLLKYASHFHARGARKGRLQTSFSQNTIDYSRVASLLEAGGYRGWIGIEYVWIDWEHCNECDNMCETILYRDFFRSLNRPLTPRFPRGRL